MVLLALTWDAWLAIALSLAAFVFGLAGFAFGFRADGRANRAEDLANRAEQRDQERIEREREQADATRRAVLAIWPRGSSATVDDRRFAYKIINHGQVAAHDVRVWLLNEQGEDVSIKPQAPFTLAPGEADDRYGVTVPLGVDPMDVRFGYSWTDGTGYHTRLLWHVPPNL